jgi:hypothetical protein
MERGERISPRRLGWLRQLLAAMDQVWKLFDDRPQIIEVPFFGEVEHRSDHRGLEGIERLGLWFVSGGKGKQQWKNGEQGHGPPPLGSVMATYLPTWIAHSNQ